MTASPHQPASNRAEDAGANLAATHVGSDAQEEWQQRPVVAAERYQQNGVSGVFRPWALDLIEQAAFSAGERVLDVACGTGVVARLAVERVGPTGSVDGLDISPAMLDVARSLPPPPGAAISWHQSSADALPFPDATFDVVTCQFGLMFFADRLRALQEMRRVLTSGGRLVLSVWQGYDQNPLDEILVDAVARHAGPHAIRSTAMGHTLGDVRDLRALVTAAGFEQIAISSSEKQHRSPSPETMVQRVLTPSMDEAIRVAIRREVLDAIQPFRDGDGVAYPMAAHLVIARA